MKKTHLLLLFCLFVMPVLAQQQDTAAIITLLKNDYQTLATLDTAKHREHCADDYLLIENGEIWDLKKEFEYLFIPRMNTKILRKDEFQFKKIEIAGAYAYAVYELKSSITRNGVTTNYHWSESAIFSRSTGKWKIKLIHSTKIS